MALHPIFRDGMVFAAGKPMRVYGTAAGDVRVTFRGVTRKAEATAEGWCATLPPAEPRGEETLTVELDGAKTVLKGVRLGEVFLAAGQSNWRVMFAESSNDLSGWKDEPRLRCFTAHSLEGLPFSPKDGWVPFTVAKARDWSALVTLFGRERLAAGAPAFGAVGCYQGASIIESWLPAEVAARQKVPQEKLCVDHVMKQYAKWNKPGKLYREVFRSIGPFAFSGVVWYQGESNTGSPEEAKAYEGWFRDLVTTWRRDLEDETLKFMVVQIADLDWRDDASWHALQRAQVAAADALENVVVVRSSDVCESANVHPRDKSRLARRLSRTWDATHEDLAGQYAGDRPERDGTTAFRTAWQTMDRDFTVCGVRYRFPGEIDWNHNPTYNNYCEWPWQFARHYFLPDLAAYYRATEDPQAAVCFTNLVGGFIDRALPPPAGTSPYDTKSWRTLDAGLRATMWMGAWPAFEKAPQVTAAFRAKFIRSLRDHIARLRPCRTYNNWRVMELGGLVEIVLRFPELDPDGAILRGAEDEYRNILATQLHPDGFSFELSPGYHGILPDVFCALADGYRAVGRTPPADLEKGLELAFELYPHLTRPDRKTPDVNDSDTGSIVRQMKNAARLFPKRADFAWFATEGREGRAPDYLSYAFPYAGAVVFRDGWSTNAVWGYCDMGPYGYAHQHEDKLNFLLFAYGKEMLTEGGIYDYDTSEMRKYVLSTRAHNTVRIDGHDQFAGATEGSWKYMKDGKVDPAVLAAKADLRFGTTPARDTASATFAHGYNANGKRDETVTHTRKVEFIKNEGAPYFRITDELTAKDGREHAYEQLWHLETCALDLKPTAFTADFGDGVTLEATFESANGRLEDRIGRKTPEWQGWMPIRPCGDHEHRPIHTPTLKGTFRGSAKIVAVFRPAVRAGTVVTAGRDWIPLRDTTMIVPGSALDFSSFAGTGGKVGAYGRVVSRNGHFEFEKLPGVPQRFYGVNFCFSANFMHEWDANELCRRLRLTGYNALRIHHYERLLCEGSKDGTTVNPKRLDELDGLMKACSENGLYVTTDLFVSRQVPYRACGIDRDGIIEMQEFKELAVFHDGVRSNLVAFTRQLLGHVNPKTGRKWAEEPALAWISLVNEGNPGNFGWDRTRRWLGLGKEVSDAELERRAVEKELDFVREMKAVLKELGYRGLVTDLNCWHNPPAYQKIREQYDYVDDHFYVDHPKFLGKDWRLPSETVNRNPLQYENRGTDWRMPVRLKDRPFTITEYNFSGPGVYRGIGGVLFGAGAALQDLDGVWRFAWSHDANAVLETQNMNYFDVARDPLVRATERAILALYLRRDLPVDRAVTRPPERDGATIAADSRQPIVCDRKRGAFCVSTPRTVGGFAEADGAFACPALAVKVRGAAAAVWATALGGDSVAASDRVLLTHLTDLQDSGAVYRDASMMVLEKWGKLPHLMRRGVAECALRVDGPRTVYALRPNGARWHEVKGDYDAQAGTLNLRLDVAADPQEATYLYEIVRPPKPAAKRPLGYQLDISRCKVPTTAMLKTVVDTIAALGYNQFQLYTEHTFAYAGYEQVWREASPMTPDEIRELDAYCAAKGVELVPNQNSFGHLAEWLRHPSCNALAEMPRGGRRTEKAVVRKPEVICPTDPKSEAFVAGLYDQLFPCFRSRFVNVGCDETGELDNTLGTGRSAAAVKEKGWHRVYLEFLQKIHALCAARGHTMMFWGDIILHRPELISELPGDVIALNWGYEADHAFEEQTQAFAKAGRRFVVCPGTSAWGSLFGRTTNMTGNIDSGFASGEKNGAYGYLLADWGDGGHPNPWVVSVPALVYLGAKARGRTLLRDELAAEIDRTLGCRVGAALLDMGDVYRITRGRSWNCAEFYHLLRDGAAYEKAYGVTDETIADGLAAYDAARVKADLTGAPAWVRDDFEMLDLLREAVGERVRDAANPAFRATFEPRYRDLWLRRNRVGGLAESLNQVFGRNG